MLGNSRISSWEQEVTAELQVDLQVDKAFGFQLLLKHPAAFAQQDLGVRNWPLQPENSRAALPLIDAPTRKRAICRMDAAYITIAKAQRSRALCCRCTARTLSDAWRSHVAAQRFSDGDLNKVSHPLTSGMYSICPFAKKQARQSGHNLQKCLFSLQNRLKKSVLLKQHFLKDFSRFQEKTNTLVKGVGGGKVGGAARTQTLGATLSSPPVWSVMSRGERYEQLPELFFISLISAHRPVQQHWAIISPQICCHVCRLLWGTMGKKIRRWNESLGNSISLIKRANKSPS